MDDEKRFSVMEGKMDDYPLIAMIQEGLRDFKSRHDTPWFLGFSTPLSSPTSQGLPTIKEADELNRWEDFLDREIQLRCKSIFVGRVTWRGNRELLYYVDDTQQIIAQVQKLIDDGKLRPFAFRYEQDPTWKNVSTTTPPA